MTCMDHKSILILLLDGYVFDITRVICSSYSVNVPFHDKTSLYAGFNARVLT